MSDTKQHDKWLIIPIEVMHRELYARLIVANIAAQRGYKVLIGQDRVIRRLAAHLPKGILFDKSIGRKGDKKVKLYSKHNFQITALDEEVTGYWANPDHFTSVRLSNEALEVSQRWFSPNSEVEQDLKKRFPDHADKFVTTGIVRVDLWRPKFNTIFDDDVARLKSEHGKFILFNSNFASVIHARGAAFQLAQRKKQRRFHNKSVEEMKLYAAEKTKNLESYLAMLPKLAAWFPDHKLIIRPHPSDDISYWQEVADQHGNAQVIFQGIVTPWILASECLVHHGCTTGIEAEFLQRPHVMYGPHHDTEHDTKEMKAFAHVVKTEDALKDYIQSALKKGFKKKASKATLMKYYAFEDDQLTSEKIVQEFDSIQSSNGKLPAYLPLMKFTPRQLVADYMPRPKKAAAYSKQKWPGISVEELTNTVTKLDNIMDNQTASKISEIFPGLFFLET